MRAAIVAAVAVALLAGLGCSSAPTPIPEPEIRIERYPLPVVVGMRIEQLPPLELEEIPTIPPANPDPAAQAAELKAWSLEVNRVIKANRAKRAARIAALELQIKAVNDFAAAHPPPPTPEPPP